MILPVRPPAALYGSVEYYEEQFTDTLCDIGDNDSHKKNALKGFIKALNSWIEYHDTAACRFEDFALELNTAVQGLINE